MKYGSKGGNLRGKEQNSMVKGLYTAYMGMTVEQKKMDRLTNNMANVDTNGYKKQGMAARSFADQLAFRIKDTSAYNLPRGLGDITFGATPGMTYIDFEPGDFKVTDNSNDFAIDGKGFFAIQMSDGLQGSTVNLTRDGAFLVNEEGYLVTKAGEFVLSRDGALRGGMNEADRVRIDPTIPYTVDENGVIYQNDAQVTQIGVVDVDDYRNLREQANNMFYPEGGQIIASNASVLQGVLEGSNVNVIDEMVEMIKVTRAYEANQKLIQTIDGDLERAVTQVGRVS